MIFENNETTVQIHGKLLKGVSGIPVRELKMPYLKFRDPASGNEYTYNVMAPRYGESATLGSDADKTFAPWKTHIPRKISPEFDIYFGAEEKELGKWEIKLSK